MFSNDGCLRCLSWWGLQLGASYVITNYSTTTTAGADIGNIQNALIPAYVQTNASQYNPAYGDSFPGNIGIKDNTIVNSLNDTVSVSSGFSIPAGFYSNIPGGIQLQTRPDDPADPAGKWSKNHKTTPQNHKI